MKRTNRPHPRPGFSGRVDPPKKTPWGTIFLTAVVAGVGTYTAMQLMGAAQKRALERESQRSSRDLLFNPESVAAPPAPRMVQVNAAALAQLTGVALH